MAAEDRRTRTSLANSDGLWTEAQLADVMAPIVKSCSFYALGEAHIPLAFEAAAEADSDAKMYYDDYNIEGNSDK
ncbi:hypothetical protein F4779DRAFT_621187 [Xylariaceae sp. FL0662B]|nr:hypothetical protein F4779DRAFT_621187 [Xylariaceae sp. FL0662B]